MSPTQDEEPSHLLLLIGGIALLVGYAILVPILGFLLASLLFMAAFMYLGRYRNTSRSGPSAPSRPSSSRFLFLRFAYVSLPRGTPPFDRFTDLIRIMRWRLR